MRIDTAALAVVRDHFDRSMYPLLDHRMSLELRPSPTGFPKFEALRRIVGRLAPGQRTLFRMFRLGETVDDTAFHQAFPAEVAAALLAGELVENGPRGWRSADLLVVPAQRMLLITGIPAGYPTAVRAPKAVFDLSTSFVAAALPASLAGCRVLDVCSGTGIQALLCAARGAREVLGLELNESAVTIARANAVLNGLADRVRFRRSDLLTALEPGERFDFVVANLPYAPALDPVRRPSTVAEIGNHLLWPLLADLPPHLSGTARGIVATWRSIGYAGRTYQLESIAARLAEHGCAVAAYVDPVFDTVDGVLDLLRNEVGTGSDAEPRMAGLRALLESDAVAMDGFYNQLVQFRRTAGRPVLQEAVTFGLS
ncbi:methyltransferase domain-containing protein [Amycolatopsis sp. NPDC051045]|uniref:methyltransferase domain-containing protein n=1 Tax=Amycolatopsis sp. NPDC051045 TaxID=3156922 RepID=UPI003430C0F0